jgi:hypothetical protein
VIVDFVFVKEDLFHAVFDICLQPIVALTRVAFKAILHNRIAVCNGLMDALQRHLCPAVQVFERIGFEHDFPRLHFKCAHNSFRRSNIVIDTTKPLLISVLRANDDSPCASGPRVELFNMGIFVPIFGYGIAIA